MCALKEVGHLFIAYNPVGRFCRAWARAGIQYSHSSFPLEADAVCNMDILIPWGWRVPWGGPGFLFVKRKHAPLFAAPVLWRNFDKRRENGLWTFNSFP